MTAVPFWRQTALAGWQNQRLLAVYVRAWKHWESRQSLEGREFLEDQAQLHADQLLLHVDGLLQDWLQMPRL